jgi:hypothetical protein
MILPAGNVYKHWAMCQIAIDCVCLPSKDRGKNPSFAPGEIQQYNKVLCEVHRLHD